MKKKVIFSLLFAVLGLASKSAVYNVMDFGAKSDGKTLATLQIQNAITDAL
jgi:polygalacturonase